MPPTMPSQSWSPTAQVIGSRGAWGQKNVFAFAGLDHDLGAFAIERFRVIEPCRGKKDRRGEFVDLLAAVFEVQPVMDAMLQVQMIRGESIVDHGHVDSHRLRRCGAAGHRYRDQQAALHSGSFHSSFSTAKATKYLANQSG